MEGKREREIGFLRIDHMEMLEIKYTVTEMKSAYTGLITGLAYN